MYFIVNIIAFLVSMSTSIVDVSIPMYLTEKYNVSKFSIGLSGFLINFSYTITTFIFSKYKEEKIFPFTIFFIGLFYLLLSALPWKVFLISLLLIGFLFGRFWPNIQLSFRKTEPKHTGYFNISWSFGIIIGFFLSGFIYSIRNSLPFIISGLLLIILGIYFILFKKNHLSLIINKNNFEGIERKNINKKGIRDVRILNFLSYFAVGYSFFIFPRYGLEIKLSPKNISFLVSSLQVFNFLTFFLIRNKPVFKNKFFFPFACFFFSLSFFLFLFLKKPVEFLIPFSIIGILSAISYHNSLISHLKLGFKTEIHEFFIGLGSSIGPICCGFLSNMFEFKNTFLIVSSIYAFLGICKLLFFKSN